VERIRRKHKELNCKNITTFKPKRLTIRTKHNPIEIKRIAKRRVERPLPRVP